MSEPTVLRWPLPTPVRRGDVQIACPVCGSIEPLTIGMDLDDRGDDPSYLTCPDGHTWAEPLFPRWMGAELLGLILDDEPGLLGELQELQEFQERREA